MRISNVMYKISDNSSRIKKKKTQMWFKYIYNRETFYDNKEVVYNTKQQ